MQIRPVSSTPQASPRPAAAPPQAAAPQAATDGLSTSSRTRLLAGLAAYHRDPSKLPEYLGGSHPNWEAHTDHCYSFVFRVAIEQGLITDASARKLMASLPVGDKDGWRAAMFPKGFTELPIHVDGEHVSVGAGAIPPGYVISLDGGDHVMVSTGKLLPGNRHEVYSFKGGGPETPVWGDSVGWEPTPKLHVLALEDELENLIRDDQPVDHVRAVAGQTPLTP